MFFLPAFDQSQCIMMMRLNLRFRIGTRHQNRILPPTA